MLGACLHCGIVRHLKPRNLCYSCYYSKPGVRTTYPESQEKAERRGLQTLGTVGEAPPTDAVPGTPDRLAVLEWRAANGLPLWNKNDKERNLD